MTIALLWVGSTLLAAILGVGAGMRAGRLRALPPAGSVLDALPPPDDDRWQLVTGVRCPADNYYKTTYCLGEVAVCFEGHVAVDGVRLAGSKAAGLRVVTAQQRRRALESWT